MRRGACVVIAAGLAATACSSGHGQRRTVTVLAAASLQTAFEAMRAPFGSAQQKFSLRFGFAGSQQLVAQVEAGARADVVATADRTTMARLQAKGLEDSPVVFARNRFDCSSRFALKRD